MVRDLPPNARGVLYMALGSFVAVVNDGLVRLATEDGVDVNQALFLRGCGVVVIFVAAGRMRRERFNRQSLSRPLVVRVAAEVVVAAAFFAAIVHIEFANAYTILMAAPFAVTVVAARRGEHVTRRRYVLMVIGFAGVVAVVRPTVAITAMAGAISVVTGWGAITPRAAAFLAVACVCLVVGYLFGIESVRVGDLSVSAPFRYTTVVGAVAVGVAVFRETPDLLTIIGCTLIVVAGAVTSRLDTAGIRMM